MDGEVKSFWIGIKLREHPLQFGTATFTESIYNKEVHEYSKKLLKDRADKAGKKPLGLPASLPESVISYLWPGKVMRTTRR